MKLVDSRFESASIPRRSFDLNDDSEIKQLLEKAAEYATHAIDNVISQLEEGDAKPNKLFYDYVSLAHSLEVHFMFPNLNEAERGILSEMMSTRSAVLVGLRIERRWKRAEEKLDHDELVERCKRRFVELKSELVNRRMTNRLTALQRRILEKEFLTIPFEG